jgi:putative PIN family toxin of toxin-antitoxin system
MIRVVLDTNIIISATILRKGHSAQVLDLWREEKIELAVSLPILEEMRKVLKRARIIKQQSMAQQDVKALIEGFRESGVLTAGRLDLEVVKEDPEDDKFIICAVEAGADYIVTGDTHLLKLKEYQGIRIVPPREFLRLMET